MKSGYLGQLKTYKEKGDMFYVLTIETISLHVNKKKLIESFMCESTPARKKKIIYDFSSQSRVFKTFQFYSAYESLTHLF